MQKNDTPIRLILANLFPYLNDVDITLFLEICQYKTFKNKEIIFQSGSKSRKAAFILKGVARGYFINKDGQEENIILRQEGTFMGNPDWIFEEIETKYNFESILESEFLIFNLVDMENIAKKNPNLFDLYTWGLKENIQTMLYRIESFVVNSPEERYKQLLQKYPLLIKTVFNKHIANFLGITPVSFSRITKRIKNSK